ncbi:MAG: hypothetical protein K0R53_1881 [Burkholderiales bacterium]|jgi:hypothetical protein|nr:hypothetical protein [Burkholderiales bacterium]
MSPCARVRILVTFIALCFAVPSLGAESPKLAKDLTATITLLGLPCGQVVSTKRLADNDYIAVCKDNNRYRVFVNAQGRVVAQKQ